MEVLMKNQKGIIDGFQDRVLEGNVVSIMDGRNERISDNI